MNDRILTKARIETEAEVLSYYITSNTLESELADVRAILKDQPDSEGLRNIEKVLKRAIEILNG